MPKLAVVRVRGSVDIRKEVKDTLDMLNLTRPNNCVIVDNDPTREGMLKTVKERITWGEINSETLEAVLRERGELVGGDRLTDKVVKEATSYSGIGEFAQGICNDEADISDIDNLKKVFRLHPPKKGFSSIHRSYNNGGALGYRGSDINELLSRMV